MLDWLSLKLIYQRKRSRQTNYEHETNIFKELKMTPSGISRTPLGVPRGQGFPTFLWPCTSLAFRQMSMHPWNYLQQKTAKNNKNPSFRYPRTPLTEYCKPINSDVVETVTFETETSLKRRDRDFIKKSETEIWNSRPRLETSNVVDFAEIEKKMLSPLPSSSLFEFMDFFRHVLIVFYLQIPREKKRVALKMFY